MLLPLRGIIRTSFNSVQERFSTLFGRKVVLTIFTGGLHKNGSLLTRSDRPKSNKFERRKI